MKDIVSKREDLVLNFKKRDLVNNQKKTIKLKIKFKKKIKFNLIFAYQNLY